MTVVLMIVHGGSELTSVTNSAIEVSELTRQFNGLIAVDHVSFRVREGEVFGFLGPNGALDTPAISRSLLMG